MTRHERLAELRARALDFHRRGLWRFAAECDRLAAALDQQRLRCARPGPMRPADVIALRVADPQSPTPGAER